MSIGREDVRGLREVIGRRLGLSLDDDRLDDLAGLAKAGAKASGADLREYVRRVDAPDSVELRALAERLTVSETFFLRNVSQFDAFVRVVLPARLFTNRSSRSLRILSAGCASGDEPYSVAIVLQGFATELAGWNVEITGVDISQRILGRARSGRFSPWSVRGTPPAWQARWFHRRGGELVLDDTIRRAVTFEHANLLSATSWPGTETYDAIFLRNVLMYFTPDAARAVVANAVRSLLPGGYLFLGHAETLRGLSDELELQHTDDAFYYRRPPEAGARACAAPEREARVSQSAAASEDWVESIRRASERIAALVDVRPTEPRGGDVAAPLAPKRGLEGVLELVEAERYDAALAALETEPLASRSEPRERLLHAVLLLQSGALPEAEREGRALLATVGLEANASYLVAMCREQAGDVDGAVAAHRDAMGADASFAMPCLHLGILARRAGRAAEARRALERAAELIALEDPLRVLLFGGGFSRDALAALCRTELGRLGSDG